MAFEENALVRHTKMPSWGVGRILKIDNELIWIEFSGAGLKKLKVEIAAELLAPVDLAALHPPGGPTERSRSAPALWARRSAKDSSVTRKFEAIEAAAW